MEKLATENLFLLEFLVDDVKMTAHCDCDTPPGEHCVSFQFLDNDPLEVCEADFSPNRKYGRDDGDIKSGKSCLFSLTPEQVQKANEVFDVMVNVFKKMQPGWLPEKICIGTALISIANLFVELIQSVEVQTEQSPCAKTLKDTFTLADTQGTTVGKISVYIRMSCFGKLIVTQFQMNLEDKSVLFKDKGGQSLYRYKKARKNASRELEQPEYNPDCPEVPCYAEDDPMELDINQEQMYPPPNPNCPMQPCFPGDQAMYPQMQNMGAGMGMGPGMGMDMCPNMGMGMGMGPGMGMSPGMGPGMGMSPGMDMGGMFGGGGFQPQNMFSPMAQSMIPCSECNMMMSQYEQPPQPPCIMSPDAMNSQMLTPCEECGTLLAPQFKAEVTGSPSSRPDPPGNYQEIGASMGGNALTIRVHKDKNRIEQIDGDSAVGGSEGSCCCTPGNLGARKPRKELSCPVNPCPPQNFDMRPGVQQGDKNLPFSFKMSGAGCPPNNNVVINPPVCTKADGTKFTEITDPNKEMFVLRIGKKSEGVQKKANLELELCTPRGPELKPIPKKETRDSQYDPADCKGGDTKGKKGKGKKGKKGKGKKDKGSKKGGKKGKGKGKKGKKK